MIRLRTATAIPLAALAFAGCGGDDGPTVSEFAKEADKVCTEGEKALEGVDRPQGVSGVPKFADDVKKVAQDTSDKMGELEKPSGDNADKAEQFVESFQADIEDQLIPKLDDIKETAEGGNEQETVQALESIGELDNDKTQQLAKDIGANACAS